MKVDTYTKAILTVIAAALVVIAIQLTPGAWASRSDVQQVDIVSIDGRRVFKAVPVILMK